MIKKCQVFLFYKTKVRNTKLEISLIENEDSIKFQIGKFKKTGYLLNLFVKA